MKKSILFLLITISLPLFAQDAKTLFSQMPDTILSIFTEINRADFADFLESNMTARIKNRLNGNSEMKTLTGDYILLETTSKSSWQMKLLALNDSTSIICTITTVAGPAKDSSIGFYTTGWEQLPTEHFISLPVEEDFLPPADGTEEYTNLRKTADMFLRKAALSSTDTTLTFTYTTPDYLDKKTAEELEKYISPTVIYQWNGAGFLR